MPKSKREKKISLTKTKKKGLEFKQKLVNEVKNSIDRYSRIFVFSVENMRNSKIKTVRQKWKCSRFFFGKNKVMMLILGKNIQSEYRENLVKISDCLHGQKGLLFTNRPKEEVLQWFQNYEEPDFAKSGNTAEKTIEVKAGPLIQFSHSVEPHLRYLGMPTTLQKGVIHLLKDFTVCNFGDVLTPEQARILKLFGFKLAVFKISLEAVWENHGSFEFLKRPLKE